MTYILLLNNGNDDDIIIDNTDYENVMALY